jgi:uncharacterized repeat protein (TIGR02543 family)
MKNNIKRFMPVLGLVLVVLTAFFLSGCPQESVDETGSVITYTINFDVNGGSGLATASKQIHSPPDTEFGALPVPVLPGSAFLGWFTATEGGTKISAAMKIDALTWPQDNTITVYAHWSASVTLYTINFNGNGGTVSPISKPLSVPPDTTVGGLPVPDRTDMVFTGWYTSASGGTLVADDTLISEVAWINNAITLYAQWSDRITTYRFIYNAGGGTVSPASKDVLLPPNVNAGDLAFPVKDGSLFMGWYTAENDGGSKVTPDTALNAFSGTGDIIEVTLYALWRAGTSITYTINFNGNGGTVTPSSLTRVYPTDTTAGNLPAPTNGPAGKNFLGWYTAPAGGIRVTEDSLLAGIGWDNSDAVTLYARWGDPLPGLKLRYDFSGSGSTVSDLAGNNDGTLIGSVALSTHNGIGIMYTGPEEASVQRTGYLDMGTGAGAVFDTNAFSIACYVKFDSDLDYGGNCVLWSFAASADAAQTDPCMLFRVKDTQFAISDQGWAGGHEKYVRTGTALEKGRWIHVLYTQNGNTGRIYINGTEVSEYTHGPSVDWTISQLGLLTHNYIARPCYGGDATLTKTSFADFMIFNIALSVEQIALINIGDTLAALNQ